MEWIVLFFLALSVYLYSLLGGADFGAGVHELFVAAKDRRKHEEVVKEAMGPVWEANHMWLIIMIVILFVGFPKVYAQVSIYLHIPITLMLMGIVLRGCAFTFRHYDVVEDSWRKHYSTVFAYSSLITPIMFGMIIGALMLGRIEPQPTDYFTTYIAPWFNIFCLTVGLFVLSIFMFLAGVFMIGEEKIGIFRTEYIKRTKQLHLVMIIAGAMVFVTAEASGLPLIQNFFSHPLATLAIILATLSHFVLWRLFKSRLTWTLRAVAGFQLFMVVAAWMAVIFPDVIFYDDGSRLSILNAVGPEKTIWLLSWALMIGAVLFLPLLVYLFIIFKGKR